RPVARKAAGCDPTPTTRPSERTGRWRMRPRRMIPSATSRVSPAASVTTSRRMRSRTFMRVGGPNSVPARAVRSPLAGFPRLGTAEGRSRSRGGFALPGGKQAAVAVGPGVGGGAAEGLLESGDDPVGELLRRRDDLERTGPALDRDDAAFGLRESGALRHVRDAAADGRRVGGDVAAGEHDAPEALAAAHLPTRGAGAPGRAGGEGVRAGVIPAPGPPREPRAAVLAPRGCGRGFRLDRPPRLLLAPGPAPVEAADQAPSLGAHPLPLLPGGHESNPILAPSSSNLRAGGTASCTARRLPALRSYSLRLRRVENDGGSSALPPPWQRSCSPQQGQRSIPRERRMACTSFSNPRWRTR